MQRDAAPRLAYGLDQKVAFAIDRTEAALLHEQQAVGDCRDLATVAEVGTQHVERLASGELLIAPEERLHPTPGKEVRVHDLVRIPAEHEAAGGLQCPQHEEELRRREILHFVDDHEVVAGLSEREPVLGEKTQIVEPGPGEPGAITLKEIVDARPIFCAVDRLAYAEREIGLARQDASRLGGDDPADFLVRLMGIEAAEGLSLAFEPAAKLPPGRLAAGRYAQRLEEFPIGEELDLLIPAFEAVGEVELTGAAREIRRMRDVECLAIDALDLLERERRLAAARAADDHDRGRGEPDRVLCIVEGERLVEPGDLAPRGMQVAHRLGFGVHWRLGDVRDLCFVHIHAAQEARPLVGVPHRRASRDRTCRGGD